MTTFILGVILVGGGGFFVALGMARAKKIPGILGVTMFVIGLIILTTAQMN